MLMFLFEDPMNPTPVGDLVFEVIQEADGGFVAECLTESIVTQADTWEELRANVKEAVEGYYFDGPKPRSIRLHLIRDEVLSIG
jgi:hypothetical protein